MSIKLNGNGFCAGWWVAYFKMPIEHFLTDCSITRNVFCFDIKVNMLNHGVGALSHEVILFSIKGGVMGITYRRAALTTNLFWALPMRCNTPTRTSSDDITFQISQKERNFKWMNEIVWVWVGTLIDQRIFISLSSKEPQCSNLSVIQIWVTNLFRENLDKRNKQAGTDLGQAKPKLGLWYCWSLFKQGKISER